MAGSGGNGAPSVLLCDYGEVLTVPPPQTDRAALASVAELDEHELWDRYWAHRHAYDRGEVTTAQYWAAILGRRPEGEMLSRLLAADVACWVHPNRDVLAATERAREAGLQLAILSNAPLDHAAVYDGLEWLAPFSPRLFSSRLGVVKPEPAIYAAAIAALGVPAGEIVFLDDRRRNVEAALAAGLRAELFAGAGQIDRLVDAAVAGRRAR